MQSPSQIPKAVAAKLISAALQAHRVEERSVASWRREFLTELCRILSCDLVAWYSHLELLQSSGPLHNCRCIVGASATKDEIIPRTTLRRLVDQARMHSSSSKPVPQFVHVSRNCESETDSDMALVPIHRRQTIYSMNFLEASCLGNLAWTICFQFDSHGHWSSLGVARRPKRPKFSDLQPQIVELCLTSMPGLWPKDRDVLRHRSLPITPRQREVVQYLLQGLPRKQIATSLGISVFTVNDHIKAIYDKLSVRSIGELASKFLDNPMPKVPSN